MLGGASSGRTTQKSRSLSGPLSPRASDPKRYIRIPANTKIAFSCDAYFVDLELGPEYIVDKTRYWFGLFSHKRTSHVWKGLLEIPLGDDRDDADALALVRMKAGA